jgi:hypothetical protein
MDKQIAHYKSVNEKPAHEIALFIHVRFAKRCEQLSLDQANLLYALISAGIDGNEAELEVLQPTPVKPRMRQQPKRASLPP